MELYLLNTPSGLKPCYDDDFDKKKRLKLGKTYKAKITSVSARNLDFHRKYFALINLAWEYQNERVQTHFKGSIECFRKTVEVAAGHCEPVYNIKLKTWIDIPKSISFGKMKQEDFEDLYERVKDVLMNTFLRHISEEEFMRNLIDF